LRQNPSFHDRKIGSTTSYLSEVAQTFYLSSLHSQGSNEYMAYLTKNEAGEFLFTQIYYVDPFAEDETSVLPCLAGSNWGQC
jgi:hypothetical protein